MKRWICFALASLSTSTLLSSNCAAARKIDSQRTLETAKNLEGAVIDRPFSAFKYARTVRVLPDGKQQFIRNDRYPIQIARDAKGRVRMQDIDSNDLLPECDKPTEQVPPRCPSWSVFVVDPAANTVSHWVEGESAAREIVDMPLSPANLDRMIRSTSNLPDVPPGFELEDGAVTRTNLGTRFIDGVSAEGTRTSIVYPPGHSGDQMPQTRIHEVWISPALHLIVRVVDGDPNGVETVWGLEKISVHPDAGLFQPPAGYQRVHQRSDVWAAHDFDFLESWFAR